MTVVVAGLWKNRVFLVTGEKMITRVRKYIRDNRMLKAEDMVVAGVSGGADSIAMLHILKNLQKEIGFPWKWFMSIMGSGARRRTG